jgi:hypothetical protein
LLVGWGLVWLLTFVSQRRARRLGETSAGLRALQRGQAWMRCRHALLVLALGSGIVLYPRLPPAATHAVWLDLKLGLVAFLMIPLEGMHAYACHVWIARGLRTTPVPPFARDLQRGLAIEEMVRTIEVPLLGVGVPLVAWLSLCKPS